MVLLSISQAATEFGVSRDTMRRTLSEAGVSPAGTGRRGHATYRLRDIVRSFNGRRGLDDMNPHLRLAQARAIETEDRIRLRRGELVEAHDVERTYGMLAQFVARAFETAPDVVERDVGLTPQQAARLEKHFDEMRAALHRQWTELSDD
ncbi:MAG TPA: DUF1441 family protein [Gammaproteobacteria bacterium]